MPIRIAVCDDVQQITNYFSRLINSQSDMELVGTAFSESSIVELVKKTVPDIVLMDIQMDTEKAGIEAIKQIHEEYPDIKVIVLTIHAEDDYIFEAYAAGAVDYILKTESKEEICQSIRRVYNDVEFIRPYIAKKLVDGYVEIHKMKQSFMYLITILTNLTNTELEILKSAYYGKSRKEIAAERCVEPNTIKYHIINILKKMHYRSFKTLLQDIKELQIFDNFFKDI
ncbi:MAG: response regulator [Monoglobaceae bacterium]